MPDTKPRQPNTPRPEDGTPASVPGQTGDKMEKQDAPFVWPRDLNAPTTEAPVWGTDPESLQDV